MVPLDFWQLLLVGFIGVMVLQLCAFAVAMSQKRVDIVDVFWGLSFMAVIGALQLYRPTYEPVVLLTQTLVVVWAIRLASHIGTRYLRTTKQDERYTTLMQSWPKTNRNLQILVRIFMVQAALATVISLPVVATHFYAPSLGFFVALGFIVWLVGFTFEVMADRQLKQFLTRPKRAELMTEGLWRYSRHPNYFGEMLMWWGLAIVSFATPLWWLGVVGASTITVLLRYVSGVPPAEARATGKKGWAEYKRTTSVLLPLPPRGR